MKHIKLLGIAATVAGALAVTAVPAAAYTPLNPDMVPALQRDLGLTADQALARLAAQDRASTLADALTQRLGATFGGASYDAATGALRVGVTDPARLGEVRAAGAEATLVRYSEATLNAGVDRLNRGEASAPRSVTSWGVDPATNRITLSVLPGHAADAGALLARSGVDGAAVTVTEAAAPRPLYNVRGGDAYYIANQARCSVGFSVRGGFLSAGHCATVGSSLAGYNRVAMGSFTSYRFPGSDYSRATTNSNWTPTSQVAGTSSRVAGSSAAAVGASVCKSGSTTGWTCGTLQAKNATVRYAEGTVYGMLQTNVRSDSGDSGGSLLAGNQGQGILSGGNTSTTYFQPLPAALSATGTTLVTG